MKVIVDLVDDSEVAASSAVFAFKVEPKSSPDPMWILGHPAVHELDARSGDLLGQAVE